MAELTICSNIYNDGEYVKDAIDSILGQTFQDFKVLIYDDGSTDNTVEQIESYNDSRITVVKGGVNRGALYARAKAIEAIDTEYAMWFDGDDVFCRNDAFECAMNRIKAGDFDMVNLSKVNVQNEKGETRVSPIMKNFEDFNYTGERLFETHYPTENCGIFPSKIFKSSLLKSSIPEEKYLSQRFFVDDIFFTPLIFFNVRKYSHVVNEEPIYTYRVELGSHSSSNTDFSLERMRMLCAGAYNGLVSTQARMSAQRELSALELYNLVISFGIERLCGKIKVGISQNGEVSRGEYLSMWHEYFCADGIHFLNNVEAFAMPSYVNKIEGLFNLER